VRARRVLIKPTLLRRRRGVGIALMGPNGAGKSTLAAGLRSALPFRSELVYMGLWQGDREDARSPLTDALRRPPRVWRRWLRAQWHLAHGRVVVFDRYVHEARLPARPPLLALKRPYHWLLARACPSPDLTIVLDAAGDVVYGRKQENPPGELDVERRSYSRMAREIRGAQVVDANRAPEAVRAEVMNLLWVRLAERWRGRRSA
jgi:thymidylate kinase